MKKNPFFSIILPVHNAEKYMRVGLDSVKSQSFTDYELIIICDDCNDETRKIAKQYGDTVVRTTYARAGLARNAGLDRARGKWILFMDDDDWWMRSTAFETIADNVGKEDEDILAFGFYWPTQGHMFNKPGHLFTAVWNKCWRRSFIEDHGFRFPDWKHSDDDGFSRLTHPKAKIAYLEEELYYYNFMREGSLTWQIATGRLDGTIPGR